MGLLMRLALYICNLLVLILPWIAYTAQKPSVQPVNIVLVNQNSYHSRENTAMPVHIRDGITDRNPCFVVLFHKSLIAEVRGTLDTYSDNWHYYLHPETNMAMCLPISEPRSFAELGFIQDDWKGPLEPKELEGYCPYSYQYECFHQAIARIFRNKAQQQPLNVMLCGHGLAGSRQKHCQELRFGTIAYLDAKKLQDLLRFLEHINTIFLSLGTCYGGGLNLLASVNAANKPSFPIVVHSMGDVNSYSDSSISYSKLFNQLPNTLMCPDMQYQAIESAIRKSYRKIPSIENTPTVYIPGRAFYEALALDNHVVIKPNHTGDITIPSGTQAIIMQGTVFHGTISDNCNSRLIPIISRIPGNAVHYIESYSNKRISTSSLIQSFLPTSYCDELTSGSSYRAAKLWLVNRLISADATLDQCALYFNGFKSLVYIATKFSDSYGMVKLPAGKTTVYSPQVLMHPKMDLSHGQYCSLIRYFCQKAQVHHEVAHLLKIPATHAHEISSLFLANQTMCTQSPQTNMLISGRLLKYEYCIQKWVQQARIIKNLQATGQYHALWHVYDTLDPLCYQNTEIRKVWPVLAQKLLDEDIIELLLYLAHDLFDEKRIKGIWQKISCPSSDSLHETPNPFELLFQVVPTAERKKQFELSIDQLIQKKSYEKILTLLTYLIPDKAEQSKKDEYFLFSNPTLKQRRSYIIQSIMSNPDFIGAFIKIIQNSFNNNALSTDHTTSIEKAKAKLLIYYLFLNNETSIQKLPLTILEDIIKGLHDKALTQDQDYFRDCGQKLLAKQQEALSVVLVIVERLVQLKLYCGTLAKQLPFDLQPLKHKLMCVHDISSAQEQVMFDEFKALLEKSVDTAIDLLVVTILCLTSDLWSETLNTLRINSLVKIITEHGHLESLVERTRKMEHDGWSQDLVLKAISKIRLT